MIRQLKYGAYFFAAGCRHVLKLQPKVKYDNVKHLDANAANRLIGSRIRSGEPFMACRFGSGEMRTFLKTLEVDMGIRRSIPEANMDSMCINAGFFPRQQDAVMRFGRLMGDACRDVDLLATWDTLPMENYVLNTWVNQALYCYLSGLEPFFADIPWTLALEGKRVVVIHPFEDSIRQQYQRKDLLFPNKKILPEFNLRTVKAVQTIAGQKDERFGDWFEALDYMYEEAMKEPFDVAVIGCGAYGFPLASKLKRAGRQAIHLGGATQLLFGIRGQRWEAKKEYKDIINENWRRPLKSERPEGAGKIEGSCYW